jgi:hypothetical protein
VSKRRFYCKYFLTAVALRRKLQRELEGRRYPLLSLRKSL